MANIGAFVKGWNVGGGVCTTAMIDSLLAAGKAGDVWVTAGGDSIAGSGTVETVRVATASSALPSGFGQIMFSKQDVPTGHKNCPRLHVRNK